MLARNPPVPEGLGAGHPHQPGDRGGGGTAIALADFPGKRLVVSVVNTSMGLPPVVVGLFVTIMLWRNGPLSYLEMLYTPAAMVFAQTIIASPIVMGISIAAIQNLPANLRLQILALGASRGQMVWLLVKEARLPLLAGIMAGFGGVISEVGASIMVGGNIKGYTRVLDHGDGDGDQPGELRYGHRSGSHPARPLLWGELPADPRAAAGAAAMTTAKALLEARDLVVARGGTEVLRVPSFDLYEHESVALIGPNGAGKSSLMLALASLLPLTAGKIRYNGAPVVASGGATAYRRRIAMVFQEPLLFDATVFDNVAAGLKIRGISRSEIRERVGSCLERFRIAHLADRSARKLSGGESQRTSLARAFATRPEVILLDEPFVALDPPTRQMLMDDLEQVLRESGTAALIATHDQLEALRLADRMVVMNGGEIVQSGTPAEVMSRPENAFVATFVGMENLLTGTIVSANHGLLALEVAGQRLEIIGSGHAGERVVLCAHPEHVVVTTIDPDHRTSARNVFPGTVTRVVPLGPVSKVYLDCGFPLVAAVTGHSLDELQLGPGSRVFASFKATAVHLFRKG